MTEEMKKEIERLHEQIIDAVDKIQELTKTEILVIEFLPDGEEARMHVHALVVDEDSPVDEMLSSMSAGKLH